MICLRSITLLLVYLATVRANEPTPCCAPEQFTIRRVHEVNDLVDGVVTSLEQRIYQAYDATNKLKAEFMWQYDTVTGVSEFSKTIFLYPQGAMYVIQDGKCTKLQLRGNFTKICVPPPATFKDTVTIGLGDFSNNVFGLRIPGESYDQAYDFVVGADNCLPYQFALRRAPPSGSKRVPSAKPVSIPFTFGQLLGVGVATPLSIRAQYYDYEEGIADPSFWFKPPAECKQGPTDKQKTSAKKMAERLMANFGKKNFVVA